MTHIAAMYQVGTGMCSALEGILIGSRRQAKGAICVVIAFFAVGVPVSYVCGFTFKMGAVGLVIGRVVGKVIQLILYSILVIRTDWNEQVDRAMTLVSKITASSNRRPTALAALGGDKRSENGIDEPLLIEGDDDDDDNDDDDENHHQHNDHTQNEPKNHRDESIVVEEHEEEVGEGSGPSTEKCTTDTERNQ